MCARAYVHVCFYLLFIFAAFACTRSNAISRATKRIPPRISLTWYLSTRLQQPTSNLVLVWEGWVFWVPFFPSSTSVSLEPLGLAFPRQVACRWWVSVVGVSGRVSCRTCRAVGDGGYWHHPGEVKCYRRGLNGWCQTCTVYICTIKKQKKQKK